MHWTLPNAMCVLRMLLVPVMVLAAANGQRQAFLAILLVSMLLDLFDGPIARRLKQTSEHGARLDSYADLAVYIALPVCATWLWPDIMAIQAPYVVVILTAYLGPVLAGIVKFGRLPSLHTAGAKLSALAIGVSALLMLEFGVLWPLRACVPLAVLTALDEFAIILLLRNHRSNVPTAWHAWRMRRAHADVGRLGDD